MKKLFLIVIMFAACTLSFSQSKKLLKIQVAKDSRKTLDFSKMDSDFEYVSIFYQKFLLGFDILNSADKRELRDICKLVYKTLNNGYKAQIIVKKFRNDQDFIINFGQWPDNNETLLITSNYHIGKKKLLNDAEMHKEEEVRDSWGTLYYIKNGKLIYYQDIDNEILSAEAKLENNLSELEKNPKPITHIMIVENYFEMNEIDKGLQYLNENKDKILSLASETSDSKNINNLITCLEEEAKVLRELKR